MRTITFHCGFGCGFYTKYGAGRWTSLCLHIYLHEFVPCGWIMDGNQLCGVSPIRMCAETCFAPTLMSRVRIGYVTSGVVVTDEQLLILWEQEPAF